MAARVFDTLRALGKGRILLNGSFQPNTANAAVLSVKGNGFSVTHTPGGNLYTVQFQDPYPDYDYIGIDVQGPNPLTTQVAAEPDFKGAKNMVIAVYSGGSPANDLAFNVNQRIHFQVLMKNTSGNF